MIYGLVILGFYTLWKILGFYTLWKIFINITKGFRDVTAFLRNQENSQNERKISHHFR
jgi:hypothetical protein